MMIFVNSSLDSLSKSSEQSFYSKSELVKQKNQQKFAALSKYKLPVDQYAIVGSGPLGVRGLREIADIDLIVSIELRNALTEKFDITDNGKVKKIVFPDDNIEAFWEGSFYTQAKNKKDAHYHRYDFSSRNNRRPAVSMLTRRPLFQTQDE